ncbi:DUF4254 domain-containing protein [Nocardia jiangxiensis]|uniref:DUF4254 domain-containing protein n=1 Tax=Nocardia jiangxiensis TaxID=282685 RepID=UPI0007C566E9|nr:DUF4254 domain-containing protein [Nocardia jiangxiensis]
MRVRLPSKDRLLEAFAGSAQVQHPVLQAASELGHLHRRRQTADLRELAEIDHAREDLVHAVDRWVSAHMPQPFGAAYMNCESVGMVLDRFARYYIEARTALDQGSNEPNRHFLWQRLAELATAYTDLAIEISGGMRRLPSFTYPAPQHDSRDQG